MSLDNLFSCNKSLIEESAQLVNITSKLIVEGVTLDIKMILELIVKTSIKHY
jgi:hypothetical protein